MFRTANGILTVPAATDLVIKPAAIGKCRRPPIDHDERAGESSPCGGRRLASSLRTVAH
jgi:hypothetical protein